MIAGPVRRRATPRAYRLRGLATERSHRPCASVCKPGRAAPPDSIHRFVRAPFAVSSVHCAVTSAVTGVRATRAHRLPVDVRPTVKPFVPHIGTMRTHGGVGCDTANADRRRQDGSECCGRFGSIPERSEKGRTGRSFRDLRVVPDLNAEGSYEEITVCAGSSCVRAESQPRRLRWQRRFSRTAGSNWRTGCYRAQRDLLALRDRRDRQRSR